MIPRLAWFLLVAVGGLLLTGTAHAEVSETVRRMAERAFLEGRLGDLDEILAGATSQADRLPVLLRDHWWRPRPGRKPAALQPETGLDDLARARLAWLRAPAPKPPYPTAGGGGDPYPVITALVQDRLRRETRGHEGLPEDGPLEALAGRLDPEERRREIYFLAERTHQQMEDAYGGPAPYPGQAEDVAQAAELRSRNGTLAALSLLVFLLLPILLGRFAFRGRGSGSAAE